MRDEVVPLPDDERAVRVQLGRPARSRVDVARRCRLGLPVVTRVPPVLDTGEPFPTRYWLTCPLALRRVARLEAAGGVRAMESAVAEDADLAAGLARAHARYAAERDGHVPDRALRRPAGGVAGITAGIKCLHAHYADHLAGNDNPVGARVAACVGDLDCTEPCVAEGERGAGRNPAWREPRA